MLRRTLIAAALLGLSATAAQLQAQTPPSGAPGGGGARQPRPDPYGDATVSRADVQAKAEAQFDALDKNHDGFLSQEEFSDMFPADSQMRMRAPMMMSRLDTNGDGKLSKEEFVGNALKRFDAMDTNHDGQLTRAERDAAREAMRGRMRNGGAGGGGWGGRGGGDGGPPPPPPGDDGGE
jgi:EF-hand domain pair